MKLFIIKQVTLIQYLSINIFKLVSKEQGNLAQFRWEGIILNFVFTALTAF